MRLFVAVWPPAGVVEQLAALERPARPGVRWTTSDHWHATLQFLGEVADVERPLRALELVRARPATAVAGPALERLGSSALCLPVAGLDELAAEVMGSTAGLVPPDPRPFRGHLTLARGRRGVDLRPLASVPVTATWPADEFTLVASRFHPQGARYQVLARYPVGSGELGKMS